MKATEFRIGNLVKTNFQKEDKIVEIKPIDFVEDYISLYQPIPLTEEKLLEFGFEKSFNNKIMCSEFSINGFKLTQSSGGHFYYGKKYIPYVHKLQNLYFEIKDVELTKNETI